MKKGFTIIEVSILFVIFMIVAILVAPLSLDDTIQAKNTSRWRNVQSDFSNIYYSLKNRMDENHTDFGETFFSIMDNETKTGIPAYRITYLNGSLPDKNYIFENYKATYSGAVYAAKIFPEPEENNLIGYIMYDVNGSKKPNIWGKDVFGLNIYPDKFEPFGKGDSVKDQREDCSKNGTGLSCSNYYLIGGNFD